MGELITDRLQTDYNTDTIHKFFILSQQELIQAITIVQLVQKSAVSVH